METVKACSTCLHRDETAAAPSCFGCHWNLDGTARTGWVARATTPAKATSDGGSTGYYKFPEGSTDLQDLIEHKKMSFARGNIFKATYRLGEKDAATAEYDLTKIIWFAQRLLSELKKPD